MVKCTPNFHMILLYIQNSKDFVTFLWYKPKYILEPEGHTDRPYLKRSCNAKQG